MKSLNYKCFQVGATKSVYFLKLSPKPVIGRESFIEIEILSIKGTHVIYYYRRL